MVAATAESTSIWDNREDLPAMAVSDVYKGWQKSEGVPSLTGFYIEDLKTVELAPWPRKGGRGIFVNLEGTGGQNDMQVVELAPAGASEPERHLYEEMVYVVDGRGSTSVWYDERRKQSFEWGPGSLFAIPLNARYQHFNGSGTNVARLASVTNAPTILNLFHNHDFVFQNPYAFTDRFAGEDGAFSGAGEAHRGNQWTTNFISDVRSVDLPEMKARGGGGRVMLIELAKNSMGAHVSQFQVGMYKKAHHHGAGAHVIILAGEGFSLLWENADDERRRCDWRPGAVVVPPEDWMHQHFNTGNKPARYLALRMHGKQFIQPANRGGEEAVFTSGKEGGWQVEYEDEDPSIHTMFEAEMAKHGATCRMGALVPWCTSKAG
ncbi:MAG: ethanolamine ammonia lyase-activating protein [Chloroflexi bacterium]|nr:ethanolamine ammonia lyase-activating protein [Chloroflexota bacterium]